MSEWHDGSATSVCPHCGKAFDRMMTLRQFTDHVESHPITPVSGYSEPPEPRHAFREQATASRYQHEPHVSKCEDCGHRFVATCHVPSVSGYSEPGERDREVRALVDEWVGDIADASRGGWMFANASDIGAPTIEEELAHVDRQAIDARVRSFIAAYLRGASPEALPELPEAYDRARRHLAAASLTDDPNCIDCFGKVTVQPLLDHIDALRGASPQPKEPSHPTSTPDILDGSDR